MPKRHKPRSGSLQYWPRKRARRIYPRTRSWPESGEARLLGFAGWKAGMTHVQYGDTDKHSPAFGRTRSRAVTILDAPPLFVAGIRFYARTSSGLRALGEKWAKNIPRGVDVRAKQGKEFNLDKADEVRLIAATVTENRKRNTSEVFELGVGGEKEEKIRYAESALGKTLSARDVFRAGEYVDVSAVTKGHGYTGAVKRYGIRIQTRKDKQMHRHVGSIGSTVPRKVDWRVPQAGQYGFFTRTEFSKRIIMVGEDGKKIVPKGGFLRYGDVGQFIMLEGSVPGPAKRMVRLRKASRRQKIAPIEVSYISTESKQGR